LYHEQVELRERILAYIREQGMISPGDRLGVAVSGGADSVALLRLLQELRSELGVVLGVVHFNHKIRGAASDTDEKFVSDLAGKLGLQLCSASGDAPAHARGSGQSLESAARDLRYAYFDRLLPNEFSIIATAHTLDDQAETVLMRLIRGSGTRGLAGIYPVLKRPNGIVVRPLLDVNRSEVLAYLGDLGQEWRDDASNLDLEQTRNRVRHKLVPLLVAEFNPSTLRVLGELSEIARGEEEFWAREAQAHLPEIVAASGLDVAALIRRPLALQRRLLRAAAEHAGLKLDFEHVERLRRMAVRPGSTLEICELPGGSAAFTGRGPERELRFHVGSPSKKNRNAKAEYEYSLPVPGEVKVRETNTIIRASLVDSEEQHQEKSLLSAAVPRAKRGGNRQNAGYNRPELLDPRALGAELTVRNWRAGDRYWPSHRRAPKKVKELLQSTTLSQRANWPVVASRGQIVWMRGFPPAADFLLKESGDGRGVLIQEIQTEPQ
jgi:tRNA(Ile)-lysidine synthase